MIYDRDVAKYLDQPGVAAAARELCVAHGIDPNDEITIGQKRDISGVHYFVTAQTFTLPAWHLFLYMAFRATQAAANGA